MDIPLKDKKIFFINENGAVKLNEVDEIKKMPDFGILKVAILDTGMLTDHPLIKGLLKKSLNLSTDSDVVDHNGHGTMVTLILLRSRFYQVELYNIKILNANRGGKREKLIEAIDWCITNNINLINISSGYYNESCTGNCEVCMAASRASENGIMINAAAGNEGRSKTICPAKAGLHGAKLVRAAGTGIMIRIPKQTIVVQQLTMALRFIGGSRLMKHLVTLEKT